jgi:hypothetical protein
MNDFIRFKLTEFLGFLLTKLLDNKSNNKNNIIVKSFYSIAKLCELGVIIAKNSDLSQEQINLLRYYLDVIFGTIVHIEKQFPPNKPRLNTIKTKTISNEDLERILRGATGKVFKS